MNKSRLNPGNFVRVLSHPYMPIWLMIVITTIGFAIGGFVTDQFPISSLNAIVLAIKAFMIFVVIIFTFCLMIILVNYWRPNFATSRRIKLTIITTLAGIWFLSQFIYFATVHPKISLKLHHDTNLITLTENHHTLYVQKEFAPYIRARDFIGNKPLYVPSNHSPDDRLRYFSRAITRPIADLSVNCSVPNTGPNSPDDLRLPTDRNEYILSIDPWYDGDGAIIFIANQSQYIVPVSRSKQHLNCR